LRRRAALRPNGEILQCFFCDMVAIRRHLRRTRYRQITADFDVLQSATQRQHASVVVAMLVISPSSPWYPVVRHLHDVMGVGYDALPATKLQNLESFVSDRVSEKRESIVPLLAALLGIPIDGHYPPLELTPQQQKRRTFSAMLELMRAQSQRQPVILVCEDIHWADHTSSELLDLIRQSISEWPILIIATFRPEFRLPWTADARLDLN
jgi:predicted ATPase